MSDLKWNDKELYNFKRLLGTFVCIWDKYKKRVPERGKNLVEKNNYPFTGQGYKGDKIQLHIEPYSSFKEGKIYISCSTFSGCYMNFAAEEKINIVVTDEKGDSLSIKVGDELKEKYIIESLKLFDDNDNFVDYSESDKDEEKELKEFISCFYAYFCSNRLNGLIKVLRQKKNIILQGAPGTGKTYVVDELIAGFKGEKHTTHQEFVNARIADKFHPEFDKEKNTWNYSGHVAFCTFHQSMDYEDFVEGIKPKVSDKGGIFYDYEKGIFWHLANAAKSDEKPYFLVIDEINRGNVSKIFGELITLLESDKRTKGGQPIPVLLPYSKEEFEVPENLYIIGTMNTTDRSVGNLDYAVRRRFAFITMKANRNIVESYYSEKDAKLKRTALGLFDQINKKDGFIEKHKIDEDLDLEDLKVGHSYFMAEDMDSLQRKMKYEVIPLIKEYMKDGLLKQDKRDQTYFSSWESAEAIDELYGREVLLNYSYKSVELRELALGLFDQINGTDGLIDWKDQDGIASAVFTKANETNIKKQLAKSVEEIKDKISKGLIQFKLNDEDAINECLESWKNAKLYKPV